MAVQKSRKSVSRKGMRRAHDALTGPTLTEDKQTGAVHRRHHMSADGSYRGRQIVRDKAVEDSSED